MKDSGIRFSPKAKQALDRQRPDANKQGYVRALIAKSRGVLKPGSRTERGVRYVPGRADRRGHGTVRQAPIGPGIHGRMADRRKAVSSFTRSAQADGFSTTVGR